MEIKMCDEYFYRINNKEVNIYEEFNSSKENVLRNNPNIDFYEGEWVKIKVNDYYSHIVKPMENLIEIAKKYAVDCEKIKADNNLNGNKLFIGQILKIYK